MGRTPRLLAAGKTLAAALERVHERDRLRAQVDAGLAALHEHMRTVAELRASLRVAKSSAGNVVDLGRRHDAAKALADADQADVKALRAKIDSLGDVDAALWRAFDEKEDALAEASPRAKEALRRVAAAIGAANARIGAVNDVYEVAHGAQVAVRRLVEVIRDAKRREWNVRSPEVSPQIDDAWICVRAADAELARLARALMTAPRLSAGETPRFAGIKGYGWKPLVDATNVVVPWLDDLFERITARRRELKSRVRDLEARRNRWVLRA